MTAWSSAESSKGPHPCDVKDNGANEGFGVAAATPTTALYDAAINNGLAFNAHGLTTNTMAFLVTSGRWLDIRRRTTGFPLMGLCR